jgi:hypothetical protein
MKSDKNPPIFNLSHYLLGVRLDNWVRLLARAKFRIEPKKIPQALFITALSVVLAPFALVEGLACAVPIHKTKLEKEPVFILGHWRSGTTYLQNLLSRDPQFGWASPMHTAMFSNCALLGWLLKGGVQAGIKGARPMDNVQYDLTLPMEETFAVGNFTPYTINHLLAFPIVWEKYIPCAFVDELPPRQRAAWKRAYAYAMKKITWLQDGKQLVLKSPDNTARVGAMLELYPDAKFVNIYRDPYDTVLSTVNMFKSQLRLVRLSKMPDMDVDEYIENVVIEKIFEPMYRDLFRRESEFKPGHYVSVCYEDFVKAPEQWLLYIYEMLEMPGYEEALPYFREFIAGQKDYQKNSHHMRPALREKINKHLGFYFEHYGYAMQTDEAMEGTI